MYHSSRGRLQASKFTDPTKEPDITDLTLGDDNVELIANPAEDQMTIQAIEDKAFIKIANLGAEQMQIEELCRLARFPRTIAVGDHLQTMPPTINKNKPKPLCREFSGLQGTKGSRQISTLACNLKFGPVLDVNLWHSSETSGISV